MWDHKEWDARVPYAHGTYPSPRKPNLWDRTSGTEVLRVACLRRYQCRWERKTTLPRCNSCLQTGSSQRHRLSFQIWLLKRTGTCLCSLMFLPESSWSQTKHPQIKTRKTEVIKRIWCEQVYLLLSCCPCEGRLSGIVDSPNAVATLAIPTAIFDQVSILPLCSLHKSKSFCINLLSLLCSSPSSLNNLLATEKIGMQIC